jgi:spermidine/putrescine transport system substrate-binding protein
MNKLMLGAAALALMAAPVLAQDADLIVFDYAGFEDPNFHTTYTAAHGASPTFAFFGDEDEALQKVTSGFQADVTKICAGSLARWMDAGILEAWDTSRITNFANIDPVLLHGASDADGNLFYVPTEWGTTAIAYNPEEVTADQVASLQVFADPAFAGRMTIPDNVDDAWALAYLATGVTDITTVTEDQFQAAAAWLRTVHPNLRTYWTDPAELAQLHATGEILISWAWNETFPTLKEEGVPVEFQREPAEGSSVWYCGLVNMTNDQGSEDKAYDYVNAFLDPSTTLPLVSTGWGQSNIAAMADQISEEDLVLSGLGAISAPIYPQAPMTPEWRERHAEEFELIKAGF